MSPTWTPSGPHLKENGFDPETPRDGACRSILPEAFPIKASDHSGAIARSLFSTYLDCDPNRMRPFLGYSVAASDIGASAERTGARPGRSRSQNARRCVQKSAG